MISLTHLYKAWLRLSTVACKIIIDKLFLGEYNRKRMEEKEFFENKCLFLCLWDEEADSPCKGGKEGDYFDWDTFCFFR
jgi:hypothetical protein